MIALVRFGAGLIVSALLVCGAAHSQTFPSKTIRFVVPFPSGSSTDSFARFLAQRLSKDINQAVIVDNKAGGDGVIAAQEVIRSAPDGYTVMLGTNSTHAANVSLFKQLSYDPVADFTPIARLMRVPYVLVVRPDFPAKNVAEFIAVAKARGGKFSFGSGNAGSRAGAELMKTITGFDAMNVAYRGIPPAIIDLLGGQIDFIVADMSTALGQFKSNALRGLAVTSGTRVAYLPDMPTLAEAGMPGYELVGWTAAFAPAHTPSDIVARLNRMFVSAIADGEAAAFLPTIGGEASPSSPSELAEFMKSETAKWARIVDAAQIERQ